MNRLSPRLEKALTYTKGFNTLADVGTDHGFLAIQAVALGYVQKAIASDNKEKPLANARNNIRKQLMSGKIELVLAEGLDHITPEVDVVSILGMGGNTIAEILSKANLEQVKRLILLPNSDTNVVRVWLEDHHFEIEDEHFLEDKHKYYQLIVAKPGSMKLTEAEREFGPVILTRRNTSFQDHLNKMVYQLEAAMKKTKNENELETLRVRVKFLKGLVK